MLFSSHFMVSNAGIYRHDVPVEMYKIFAQQEVFDCAGEVLDEHGGSNRGSCVLIGDRYVLTAAHLFIESDNAVDTQYVIGDQTVTMYKQVNVRVGEPELYLFRFKRKMYNAVRIIIFPAYLDSATKGTCDMALVELEENVEDVSPATLNKKYDELNSLVTGVGFGVSGRADRPEEVGVYMEKIAGQNIIDEYRGYEHNGQKAIMVADLDHPFKKELCNKTGSAEPLLLEYKTGGGDSGSPLFRQQNDEWELIGICTGGGVEMSQFMKTGYYGQQSEWTRVSLFYDWVQKTLKNASDE